MCHVPRFCELEYFSGERQIEEDDGLQTGGFDKWEGSGKTVPSPRCAHGEIDLQTGISRPAIVGDLIANYRWSKKQ
jgi:hypothetical protein